MNIIDQLKEYDRLYFNEGTSPITDTEYDQMKTAARKQFPSDPYFEEVGAPVILKYEEIKLPFVIGGLDKVTPNDVVSWTKGKSETIVASEKLDGNSIICEWENKDLILAATRGDSDVGQNILEKAKYFVPNIPINDKITLRGEILLENDLYKYLGFKNRRNGVAGLIRREEINPHHLKLLTVIFYEIIDAPNIPKTELERISFIHDTLKLPFARYIVTEAKSDLGEELSQRLYEFKESSAYDIDGLVLTINHSERENVKHPKNKVKFKVNEEAIKCNVLGLEWNITRTGLIKPVILIEPTEIQGVTVSRASGFNMEFIVNNGIDKNSIVGIVRSGDVIPYVTEVYEQVEFPYVPAICPSCFEPTTLTEKEVICTNPGCHYKRIYEIAHFFESLGCENLSEKTFEKINLVSYVDIYNLKVEDLEKLPGFGKSKATMVVNEIQKTLKTKPENLLAAFGIPMIGRTISKQLCSKFKFDELFDIKDPEILGLGEITSKTFIENINQYKAIYEYLLSIGLEFEEENLEDKTLKGIKFALTGDGPMKRSEIQKLIEAKGGEVKSVGKETNYLVTSDPDSNSGKMKSAKKYGTKVIDYNELIKMLK